MDVNKIFWDKNLSNSRQDSSPNKNTKLNTNKIPSLLVQFELNKSKAPVSSAICLPHCLFHLCLTVFGCLLMTRSRRGKRWLFYPHIFTLTGCRTTSSLRWRKPSSSTSAICWMHYAPCVCDINANSKKVTYTKRPCFHTCSTFPGICVHLSVRICVW